ncbi:MAG TPA: DUF305 domain-containing protein, partial [Longimicrobiaceae bacterium]|nr:DUF305 domain-containing protein [Longimicrobiaceae bacterium]
TAPPSAAEQAAMQRARADSARHPWTDADARFMTNMIGHHAQAIVMAQMAPSHGASPQIQTLAGRIINAQRDEIVTMQTWLRDRGRPVPQVGPGGEHAGHDMGGMQHDMAGMQHDALMPGMLTPEQLAALDAARGPEFDRMFLRLMIQHHSGAVQMVSELFGSYGAGQDETVFKFASDVNVDQTTEIARMQRMLADLIFGESTSP